MYREYFSNDELPKAYFDRLEKLRVEQDDSSSYKTDSHREGEQHDCTDELD